MGFQMVDRGKFKIYEKTEHVRFLTDSANAQAERKEQEAAERHDGVMDMANQAERMGRVIRVGTFIDKLRLLNPKLIIELSSSDPTKYGVYTPDPAAVLGKRFVVGMESGINLGGRINEGVMPEFSILVVADETVLDADDTVRKKKKFKREIRGWRTVLAALYLEQLLTEAQIEHAFKISEGKDSENWQKRLGKTNPSPVGATNGR